jgi:hypothetical protein
MNFAPLIPVWLMALVVVLTLTLTIVTYRRPSRPSLLRLAVVIILAIFLANPVRLFSDDKREPPRLALVLDVSGSMATDHHGVPRDRAARAQLNGRYQIERYGLSEDLSPGFPALGAGGTAFDRLARFADGQAKTPVAAIILASDGIDRGSEAPDAGLAAAAIPVFALAVGGPEAADNASVRLEGSSPTAFPGQELTLTAVVNATGSCIGRQSELTLLVGDEPAFHKTITLTGDDHIEVQQAVGDQPGEKVWRLSLAPIPGEATLSDNDTAVAVQVVDRPVRVLVLEGQPYWDTTFAIRSWRRDRQLSVSALYGLGSRRVRSGKETPDKLDAERLQRTDVVVIGSRIEDLLDAQQQRLLMDYVNNGGGLLLIGLDAGLSGTLAELDPLLRRQGRKSSVLPKVSDSGRRLALLPQNQKSLTAVTAGAISGIRPRSDILLGDEQCPLVVVRRSGGGRVATVNAEGVWHWSLSEDDGEVAARFWRQLVKSLVVDASVTLRSDRPRYRTGQEAVISVTGKNPVSVRDPAGAQSALVCNEGEGRIALNAPGCYTLTCSGQQLTLVVDADEREITDIARRDDRLARLAEATAGDVVECEQADELARRLARRTDLQVVAARAEPMITSVWWLLTVITCCAAEWWLRRRKHGVI